MSKKILKFQVVEAKLAGQVRYVARIPNPHNYDQTAVVNKMMDLGTSVSRGEVESVLLLLQETVRRICGEGSTASLDGFVRFAPAISGTFENALDGFSSGRNLVYVNAQVSSVFNDRFALETSVEKTSAPIRSPQVQMVIDSASETRNEMVTPLNIVTVAGEGLKFDPLADGEYLRFVNDKDPSQFIAITKFHKLTDKELVFLLPAILFPSGYFELASAMNTSRIRTERSKAIQVVA